MRQFCVVLWAIVALMFCVVVMNSCKTSEKNYRQAYEQTMVARDSSARDFDETIYGRYRQQLHRTSMVLGGDTLDIRTQSIRLTEGGGGVAEPIKKYMVVVGEFKQLFNARSLRERLVAKGYSGAFIVETGEPYYYVIALAFDGAEQALEEVKKLKKNPPFKLRGDLPFVLSPTRRR